MKMNTLLKSLLVFSVLMLCTEKACASALDYDVALRDSILSNISGATISDNTVNILRYGAKADGEKYYRNAFEKAIKEGRK